MNSQNFNLAPKLPQNGAIQPQILHFFWKKTPTAQNLDDPLSPWYDATELSAGRMRALYGIVRMRASDQPRRTDFVVLC